MSGFALIGAVIAVYRGTRWAGWGLWIVVVLLGVLHYHTSITLSPLPHMIEAGLFGQRGIFTGRVVEEPERGGSRTRFVVELGEVLTERVVYRVTGWIFAIAKEVGVGAEYGDRISLEGRLDRPRVARNPGAFDYRNFLAQQRIYATLFIGQSEQVVAVERLSGHWFHERVVLTLRRVVRSIITRNLEGAQAELLLGLLLGEKRRIPEEVRIAFRGTGLAHALVASGLHVGLVASFFFFFFESHGFPAGRVRRQRSRFWYSMLS